MIQAHSATLTEILFLLVTGLMAAYLAKKRKKNPILWFMAGFFFGFIGLCFLLFLPSFKKFLQKKNGDTKATPPPPVNNTQPLFPLNTIWYYLDRDSAQKGPVSFQLLQKMKDSGDVQEDTYIWNESFIDWKKWDEVFPKLELQK